MQSRTLSLIESVVNTASGFLISLGVAGVVFPWFGLQSSLQENATIVGIFTIVSVIRSYLWRRIFNWQGVR